MRFDCCIIQSKLEVAIDDVETALKTVKEKKEDLEKKYLLFLCVLRRVNEARDSQKENYTQAKNYKVHGEIDRSFVCQRLALGAKDCLKKYLSKKNLADMYNVSCHRLFSVLEVFEQI